MTSWTVATSDAEQVGVHGEGGEGGHVRSPVVASSGWFAAVKKRGVGGEDGGAHVEQLGDLVLDDRGAEHSVAVQVAAGLAGVLGDVEDLVDDQPDAAAGFGVDHDLQGLGRAGAVGAEVFGQAQQRQDLAAVLHYLAPADVLNGGDRELFEAGDRGQRYGDAAALAQSEDQLGLTCWVLVGDQRGSSSAVSVLVLSTLELRASDMISRIRATRPSPRMVAPAYSGIRLSCTVSG
jgi:hypothetical protein